MRCANRVALVTGAARGIGRGIALRLAREGADIIVNDYRASDDSTSLLDAIQALGRRALFCQADVADRSALLSALDQALATMGRLDIAVANAGRSLREPVIEAQWPEILRTIEVCQFGVFHTCQYAAQQMVHQGGGGKIVIISSLHAEVAFPGSAAYNMAKAAINHLCETMATELAGQHINVNVINPGWIDTPGERAFATEQQIQSGGTRIPWGRLGTPADIAGAVAFLVSDDADYITGTTLRVDGGFKLGMQLPGE